MYAQACKQLHSLSGRSGDDQHLIDRLRSAMAEAQHHDGIYYTNSSSGGGGGGGQIKQLLLAHK